MKIRLIDGRRNVVEQRDVAELVVMTDSGEPVSVSIESLTGIISTAHAAEKDFKILLSNCGMRPANIEVVRPK